MFTQNGMSGYYFQHLSSSASTDVLNNHIQDVSMRLSSKVSLTEINQRIWRTWKRLSDRATSANARQMIHGVSESRYQTRTKRLTPASADIMNLSSRNIFCAVDELTRYDDAQFLLSESISAMWSAFDLMWEEAYASLPDIDLCDQR